MCRWPLCINMVNWCQDVLHAILINLNCGFVHQYCLSGWVLDMLVITYRWSIKAKRHSCSLTGGTTYTEDEIIWRIPRVIPTLSSHEEQFYDNSIVLGVNGVPLTPDKMAELNYPLAYNDTNIVVTIPIGAKGGNYKVCTLISEVLNS